MCLTVTVHRSAWRCSSEDVAALRTVHSLVVTYWLLFLAGLVGDIQNIQTINNLIFGLHVVYIHTQHLVF